MGTAGAAPALQYGDGAMASPVARGCAKGTALTWPQRGRLERRFYFLGPTLPLPFSFFFKKLPVLGAKVGRLQLSGRSVFEALAGASVRFLRSLQAKKRT
jgi:hypothetical protein